VPLAPYLSTLESSDKLLRVPALPLANETCVDWLLDLVLPCCGGETRMCLTVVEFFQNAQRAQATLPNVLELGHATKIFIAPGNTQWASESLH